jgi:exodeoxyribonuclease VII small subunit
MAMPPSKNSPPFEEMYKQLEEKVALLEQGGLSLDDSLSAYEEAVGLAQKCQDMLDKAELRITRLRQSIATPDAYVAEPEDELPRPDDPHPVPLPEGEPGLADEDEEVV